MSKVYEHFLCHFSKVSVEIICIVSLSYQYICLLTVDSVRFLYIFIVNCSLCGFYRISLHFSAIFQGLFLDLSVVSMSSLSGFSEVSIVYNKQGFSVISLWAL